MMKIKELKLDPDSINKLHWEQNKSLPEIGILYKINSGTLYQWMKLHGIPVRSRKEAAILRRKVFLNPD